MDPRPAGTGEVLDDQGPFYSLEGDDAEDEEAGDSIDIADETTARLTLEITAESGLEPNATVTLKISGVATEVVDGGTVELRLPTKAMMDHAGAERQPYLPVDEEVSAHASWTLPSMAVGDTWEETVDVPAAVGGYYLASAFAETYGPESDLGPHLTDDVYTQSWMFVSSTDGQLTDIFEDSIFPEGTRAVPGPFTTEEFLSSRSPRAGDKVYASVTYYDGRRGRRGFQPAVDANIWARDYRGRYQLETVPENGIVAFDCQGQVSGIREGAGCRKRPSSRVMTGSSRTGASIRATVAIRSPCTGRG